MDIEDSAKKDHKETIDKLDGVKADTENLRSAIEVLTDAAHGKLPKAKDDSTLAERKAQVRNEKAILASKSEQLRIQERDEKIAAAATRAADKKKRDDAKTAKKREDDEAKAAEKAANAIARPQAKGRSRARVQEPVL